MEPYRLVDVHFTGSGLETPKPKSSHGEPERMHWHLRTSRQRSSNQHKDVHYCQGMKQCQCCWIRFGILAGNTMKYYITASSNQHFVTHSRTCSAPQIALSPQWWWPQSHSHEHHELLPHHLQHLQQGTCMFCLLMPDGRIGFETSWAQQSRRCWWRH